MKRTINTHYNLYKFDCALKIKTCLHEHSDYTFTTNLFLLIKINFNIGLKLKIGKLVN